MLNIFKHAMSALVTLGVATCPLTSWSADWAQSLDGLLIINCSTQKGVITSKYAQRGSKSAYTTEFDRREVSVASSNNIDSLYKKIGFVRTGQSVKLNSTQLALPPYSDQIENRHVLGKSIQKGDWTIFLEVIQYGSQGSAPGFVMECGTAIRFKSTDKNFISISECFPNENREKFFRMLINTKTSTLSCQPSE